MSSKPSIDLRQVLAVVLALVVVASISGSATVALLSDSESIAVGLTASNADTDAGGVSGFNVEPLDTCAVDNATANGRDLRAAAKFEVEGDGCAQISVWVSESWLDRTGEDVGDVVIGHKGASGWVFLETDVGEQKHGWYELTATTTGFSPFGLFVPSESRASPAGSNAGDAAAALDSNTDVNQTENESIDSNRTVTGNSTEMNGSVGGTAAGDVPDPGDGNESAPANGSTPTNETAGDGASQHETTPDAGDDTEGDGDPSASSNETARDTDGDADSSTPSDGSGSAGGEATQNGTATDTDGSNGADSNETDSGSSDDETAADSGETTAETTESAASGPDTETPEPEPTETETAEPQTDETTTETETTDSASTATATEDGETTATPSSQDA